MPVAVDETLRMLREKARLTWASGDYDAVADGIWEAGGVVVDATGVTGGDDVLDVACGTGNATIRAALAGGRVTGLDLTPELFEAARRRAAEAGVDIDWIEGDAEELPFPDRSFDVVLSTFGVMFAPRHRVAAAEMARVLRPGGRIGLTTWTPEGSVARVFTTAAGHLPPAPDIAESPLLWGVDEHVHSVFEGSGIDLAIERRRIQLDPDIDVAEATDFYVRSFGPIVQARELLEPQGRWEPLLDELRPAIENMLRDPAEYLVITGTKRG